MKTIRMAATVAILGMIALTAGAQTAIAQNYPWCGIVQIDTGMAENCGFVSYEQCFKTVEPQGGYCERNRNYRAESDSRSERRRQR